MIELLAPAGNMEKLKTAIYFGADACYFAGTRFGLRAMSSNFTNEELRESVDFVHSHGKKCYITVNILAHNADFDGLKEYLEFLQEIGVDGVIVSDLGIMRFVKEYAPRLELHVSTQSNITNKYSAMEFVKLGAKRLVLARELSIEEIKEIRDYIPKAIEIECFVHGAMCISYSGRCLLSNYMCGRDSNRGACVQACRFEYTIREKSRPNGNEYEIQEDNRGTYILNSKDMCLIKHIAELVSAGITSFKIEGRMKSPYYVATVTNAYRRAIDLYLANPEKYECPVELYEELEKTSHRRFTTGFYFHADDKEFLETSMPIQSHEFMAVVVANQDGNKVEVEQRNRFKVGDELEILSPTSNFNKTFVVGEMRDDNGELVVDALKVQQRLILTLDGVTGLQTGDILRKKI